MEPNYNFVAHKAGMEETDKEKINKIVLDATRNSSYYKHKKEKREKYEEKIRSCINLLTLTMKNSQEIKRHELIIEKKLQEIEKMRKLNRVWVHFDMDMFFVACELRLNCNFKFKNTIYKIIKL